MFTRPLDSRVGVVRDGDKRNKLARQLVQQKMAHQRAFPAIARGAKQRFGGFGSLARSFASPGRPILGHGGMPGVRDFLPMPGFDRMGPPQHLNPNLFGLAPVEPGQPGAAPDFVQQIQDAVAGMNPQSRPDASGPINWGALGIPDPTGTQTLQQPANMPGGGLQPGQTQTLQSGIGLLPGVGQAPSMAGGLIPLGGGQYLDPNTGVVHGVGGLSMQ